MQDMSPVPRTGGSDSTPAHALDPRSRRTRTLCQRFRDCRTTGASAVVADRCDRALATEAREPDEVARHAACTQCEKVARPCCDRPGARGACRIPGHAYCRGGLRSPPALPATSPGRTDRRSQMLSHHGGSARAQAFTIGGDKSHAGLIVTPRGRLNCSWQEWVEFADSPIITCLLAIDFVAFTLCSTWNNLANAHGGSRTCYPRPS